MRRLQRCSFFTGINMESEDEPSALSSGPYSGLRDAPRLAGVPFPQVDRVVPTDSNPCLHLERVFLHPTTDGLIPCCVVMPAWWASWILPCPVWFLTYGLWFLTYGQVCCQTIAGAGDGNTLKRNLWRCVLNRLISAGATVMPPPRRTSI